MGYDRKYIESDLSRGKFFETYQSGSVISTPSKIDAN